MPEYYHPAQPVIDAGVVPQQEREAFRITEAEWLEADHDVIEELNGLRLYANQQYQIEREFPSGDTIVLIRYLTPCITTLEVK